MVKSLILSLIGITALLPATLIGGRPLVVDRPVLFWMVVLVAVVGTGIAAAAPIGGGWATGFSEAIWLSIVTTLVVFTGLALFDKRLRRLANLLFPYLLIAGLIAALWSGRSGTDPLTSTFGPLLAVHIAITLVTYALLTLAALCGLAVFLRERALKARRSGGWIQSLPAVAEAERLQMALLAVTEVVLFVGILTGIAVRYGAGVPLFVIDHKALLTLLAFLVIALILALHWYSGMRGRRIARIVLVAYLLVTLAYPGVKFVTDVLLS